MIVVYENEMTDLKVWKLRGWNFEDRGNVEVEEIFEGDSDDFEVSKTVYQIGNFELKVWDLKIRNFTRARKIGNVWRPWSFQSWNLKFETPLDDLPSLTVRDSKEKSETLSTKERNLKLWKFGKLKL